MTGFRTVVKMTMCFHICRPGSVVGLATPALPGCQSVLWSHLLSRGQTSAPGAGPGSLPPAGPTPASDVGQPRAASAPTLLDGLAAGVLGAVPGTCVPPPGLPGVCRRDRWKRSRCVSNEAAPYRRGRRRAALPSADTQTSQHHGTRLGCGVTGEDRAPARAGPPDLPSSLFAA